jgi:hypothetical protein
LSTTFLKFFVPTQCRDQKGEQKFVATIDKRGRSDQKIQKGGAVFVGFPSGLLGISPPRHISPSKSNFRFHKTTYPSPAYFWENKK